MFKNYGLPSATYQVAKPYGEIFSWRLYARDQAAPLDTDYVHDLFSLKRLKAASSDFDNVDIVCKTVFENPIEYRFQFDNNLDAFTLQTIENMACPFVVGDWLCLHSTKAYTVEFGHILPLVKVGGIRYRDESRRMVVVLQPCSDPILTQELTKFYTENNDTPDNIENNLSSVRCEKVHCTITTPGEWGWTGDNRRVKIKSNNNDQDKYMFQIVCTQIQSANDGSGFSKIASTQWSATQIVKNTLESAAAGLVEKMTREYTKSVQEKFLLYQGELQEKFAQRMANTFSPVSELDDGKHSGGYVLLRCLRANNEQGSTSEVIREQTRYRMRLYQDTDDERNRKRLRCSTNQHVLSDNQDAVFELVAGSLDFADSTAKDMPISSAPPTVGLLSDDETTIFSSLHTEKSSAIDLNKYLRFRLQNSSKSSEIEETLNEFVSFDKPAMPFEYNAHHNNSDHFKHELDMFVDLVLQCLLATFTDRSFDQKVEPFKPTLVPGALQPKLKSVIRAREDFLSPIVDKMDIAIYSIDTSTAQRRNQLETAINSSEAWVSPDDDEKGACATLLWQPAIEFATGETSRPPSRNDIERLMTTTTPFGKMPEKRRKFLKSIKQTCMDQLMIGTKSPLLLKQSDTSISEPEYTPLLLEYDLSIQDETLDNFTWSIGGGVSLLSEAMEMAIL